MPAPLELPNPQAVRAIFFDVGFTLLAPHPSVTQIALDATRRLGVALDVNCLRQQQKRSEEHLRSMSKAKPWTWGDETAINETWTSYFTEMLRPCLADQPEQLEACVQ